MVAVRFTFGYRGDDVWLADRQVIQTVAPLSAPLVDLAERSGFWCELRDGHGVPLHRQALRDPRHPSDEVPGRMRHVPRPEPGGVFTVVVPVVADATLLALIQRRTTDSGPRDVITVELP